MINATRTKKPRRGFSLVELLAVLAIVAILAALIGGAPCGPSQEIDNVGQVANLPGQISNLPHGDDIANFSGKKGDWLRDAAWHDIGRNVIATVPVPLFPSARAGGTLEHAMP